MWIDDLFLRRDIRPSGVIHVGAHKGEELYVYRRAGVPLDRILWVEAIPEVADALRRSLPSGSIVETSVVSDVRGPVSFNVTNNVMSSSMLPLGTHSLHHPDVVYVRTLALESLTLPDLLARGGHSPSHYDTLVLDIQGAELKALRGMGESLEGFKHIVTEINTDESYSGGALFSEITSFLEGRGLALVEHHIFPDGCGDAYFSRLRART